MERKKFDIAVIGSGPGGYTAAIRAAQLGKTVALIEKKKVGGTCLNVGCIPSKALLSCAAVLQTIRRTAEFGIEIGTFSFQYSKMKTRKDLIVNKLRAGLENLLKANKISIFRGTAQFASPRELKILGHDNLFIEADKIIIATGSSPLDIKAFPCDHKRIVNSSSLLEITEVPKHLAIIGGGYIGCEFASLFAELGAKVTIFEALPTILALQGKQVAQFMTKTFTAKGISLQTNTAVQRIEHKGAGVSIVAADGKTVDADLCLISVGRLVSTEALKLVNAGLTTSEKGFIKTNPRMETEVSGIYAIGDVTGKSMLAHVAAHQGMVAAANACGREEKMHYDAIPAIIFTSPEVATVGLTLEMATEAGYLTQVGTLPFQVLGKAHASSDTEGFAQIIADKKTGQILGAVAIGHEASNLISEMALAIRNELTLDSVIETVHAHPTLAEGWLEAALIAAGRPINMPPKASR